MRYKFKKLTPLIPLLIVFLFAFTANAETSITVGSGSKFGQTSHSKIGFNGDLIVDGNFVTNLGDVVLNGTQIQQVVQPGGNFHGITINNPNVVFQIGDSLYLGGDWENNTNFELQLPVIIDGSTDQTIENDEVFGTVFIRKSGGVLNLNNSLTISDMLIFSGGHIITNPDDTNPDTLLLKNNATLAGENDDHYILGYLQKSKAVGAGASDFDGIGVQLAAGNDDLGQITIVRTTGYDGEVKIFSKPGIKRKWYVAPTGELTQEREITLEWLSSEDNDIDLTTAQVWFSEDGESAWRKIGEQQDVSNERSISVLAEELGYFTVNDKDVPPPDSVDVDLRLGRTDIAFEVEGTSEPYQIKINATIRADFVRDAMNDVKVHFWAQDMTAGIDSLLIDDGIYLDFPDSSSGFYQSLDCSTIWSPPDYHQYRIYVTIDPENQFTESVEDNNTKYKNFNTCTFNPATQPDISIIADDVIFTRTGTEPNQDVKISATINGEKPLAANMNNVIVRFFYEDVGERAKIQIGEDTILNFDNGTTTESQTVSYTWAPASYLTTYNIFVEVDCNDLYGESNEDNNTVVRQPDLQNLFPPDIAVTPIQFEKYGTGEIKILTTLSASDFVASLANIKVDFYAKNLATDEEEFINSQNFLFDDETSFDVEQPWHPPTYDNFLITVVAESDTIYIESNEDNNTQTKNIDPGDFYPPDLYVSANRIEFSKYGNEAPYPINIEAYIFASNFIAHLNDVQVEVYVKDLTENTDEELVSTHYVNFTDPDQRGDNRESHTINAQYLPPVPNKYRFTIKVDTEAKYVERQEANNIAYKDFGGFKITNLTAKYDNTPGDPQIIGPFFTAGSLTNTFTVDVDDPDNLISRVQYFINDEIFEDTTGYDDYTLNFDMINLLHDDVLTVKAINDEWGYETEEYSVNIDILDDVEWWNEIVEKMVWSKDFGQGMGLSREQGHTKGDTIEFWKSFVTIDFDWEAWQMILGVHPFNFERNQRIPRNSPMNGDVTGGIDLGISLGFPLKKGADRFAELELRYVRELFGGEDTDVGARINFTLDKNWEIARAEFASSAYITIYSMPRKRIANYGIRGIAELYLDFGFDAGAVVDLLFLLNKDFKFMEDEDSGDMSHLQLGINLVPYMAAGGEVLKGGASLEGVFSAEIGGGLIVEWKHKENDGEYECCESQPAFYFDFNVDIAIVARYLWGLGESTLFETRMFQLRCQDPGPWPRPRCGGCVLPAYTDACFGVEDLQEGDHRSNGSKPTMPRVFPYPTMASDSEGNVYVVYLREITSRSTENTVDPDIYVFVRDTLGNLSNPEPVTNNAFYETNPMIGIFGNNDKLVVWTQNDITKENFDPQMPFSEAISHQDIFYSYGDSTGWSQEIPVIDDSGGELKNDGSVAFGITGADTAVVCWVRAIGDSAIDQSQWDIYYSIFSQADSTWTEPTALTGPNDGGDGDLNVSYHPTENKAMAVWVNDADASIFTTEDNFIYYSEWNGNQGWSTVAPIYTNDDYRDKSPVVAYLDTLAVSIWVQDFPSIHEYTDTTYVWSDSSTITIIDTIVESLVDTTLIQRLMYSEWNGSHWTVPDVITEDNMLIQNVTIAVNPNDVAIVTFRKNVEFTNQTGEIFSVVRDYGRGGIWSEPRQVTDNENSDLFAVSIVDENNNSVVISQEVDLYDTTGVEQERLRYDPYAGMNIISRGIGGDGNFSERMNMNSVGIAADLKILEDLITLADCDTCNSISDTLSVGDTLWITVPIQNVGYLDTEIATVMNLLNSPGGIATQSFPIPPLVMDSIHTVTFTVSAIDTAAFYFEIDPEGLIPEQSDANNFAEIAYKILPDLTITDVWFSDDAPEQGDTLFVCCKVKNLSGKAIENTVVPISCLEYSLTDTIWDWTPIANYLPTISYLPVDSSYVACLPYVVLEGEHQFDIIVNPDSIIPESNYDNNDLPLHEFLYALPELVIDTLNVLGGDGSFTQIEAVIRNTGLFLADSVTIELFDGYPTASGTTRHDSTLVLRLFPFQEKRVILTFTGNEGEHELYVWINRLNTIQEQEYANNWSQVTIYQYPGIDLSVETEVDTLLPALGDTIEIEVIVQKDGDEIAEDIPVTLSLIGEDSSEILQSTLVNLYGNGATESVTFIVELPDSTSNIFRYRISVNDDKFITEANWANNTEDIYVYIDGHYEAADITSNPVELLNAGELYEYDVDAMGFPIPEYLLGDGSSVSRRVIASTKSKKIRDVSLSKTVSVSVSKRKSKATAKNSGAKIREQRYEIPQDMTIDGVTGLIQWETTIADTGLYDITVKAENNWAQENHTDIQDYTLTVGYPPEIVSIPPDSAAYVGELYEYDVDATGYPASLYGMDYGNRQSQSKERNDRWPPTPPIPIPPTINPTTGLMQILPNDALVGIYDFTISASNPFGHATQEFSIYVYDDVLPQVISEPNGIATVDSLYQYQIESMGFPAPPCTYALPASRSLENMTINEETGLLQFTPTDADTGLHNITVSVINHFGTTTYEFPVTVIKMPEIISEPPLIAIVDSLYQYQVLANGYPFPDFSVLIDEIQEMEIGSNGLIEWIFNREDAGNHQVEILAINDAGEVQQTYELWVRALKIYDINGDGVLDIEDIQKMASKYGTTEIDEYFNPDFDYNDDGILDNMDLKLIILQWKKDE